jgi:hypothetical protein
MSRCGLVLAAILAASPVSAANVTTWANAGWANLADCTNAPTVMAFTRGTSGCVRRSGPKERIRQLLTRTRLPPKLQRLRTVSVALHAEE